MTRKRNFPNNSTKDIKQSNRKSKRSSFPVRYRLLAFACCLFLIVGFFFAARQHFASIDYSMRNSKLRRMGEELVSEKRRLLLAKEIALSPTEIKKAAQKIGFRTMSAANSIQFPNLTSASIEKSRAAEKSETAKPKPVSSNKGQEPVENEKSVAKPTNSGPKAKKEANEGAR